MSTSEFQPVTTGQAHENVDALMAHIEAVTTKTGSRLTPIRRHVYKCLLKSPHPLGAYEILDMLDGVGAAKPPTVYRALEWLLDLGLIRKVSSVSKFVALPQGQSFDPVAVLLCRECGRAEILNSDGAVSSIINAAKSQGLEDVHATLEIVGQCKSKKKAG